jgi:hypothetical protein
MVSLILSRTSSHLTTHCGAIRALSSTSNPALGAALRNINQYTLDLYAQRKSTVRRTLGNEIPVILHNGDHLTSLSRGTRSVVQYVPESYHMLKAIAHIPLAIHSMSKMHSPEESKKGLLTQLEVLFSSY